MRRAREAVLLICALAGTASAETPTEQAERLFKEGRAALKDDPKKACELFEDSIKIDPTATGVMLNLGLCYEKLNKVASSLFWFRKAQSAAAESNLTAYENAAKEHTTQLSSRVSLLSIKVDVPGAEVRVDNRRVEATQYGRVEVDAGPHTITASAPDKIDAKVDVSVAEAESKEVVLTFQNTVLVDTGKGRRRLGIGLAVGGSAAMIGSLVWVLADRKSFDDEMATVDQREDLQFRQRYLNTSLFGVGLAAVGIGAYFYFSAPGLERVAEGTALRPVVSPDGVGFALDGRF